MKALLLAGAMALAVTGAAFAGMHGPHGHPNGPHGHPWGQHDRGFRGEHEFGEHGFHHYGPHGGWHHGWVPFHHYHPGWHEYGGWWYPPACFDVSFDGGYSWNRECEGWGD